jgi:hypothetical protein
MLWAKLLKFRIYDDKEAVGRALLLELQKITGVLDEEQRKLKIQHAIELSMQFLSGVFCAVQLNLNFGWEYPLICALSISKNAIGSARTIGRVLSKVIYLIRCVVLWKFTKESAIMAAANR